MHPLRRHLPRNGVRASHTRLSGLGAAAGLTLALLTAAPAAVLTSVDQPAPDPAAEALRTARELGLLDRASRHERPDLTVLTDSLTRHGQRADASAQALAAQQDRDNAASTPPTQPSTAVPTPVPTVVEPAPEPAPVDPPAQVPDTPAPPRQVTATPSAAGNAVAGPVDLVPTTPTPAPQRPSSGQTATYKAYAATLVTDPTQMACLDALWQKESGWNPAAQNPRSTAYGIPQFLDSTWAGTGIAKTADPQQQIKAGLTYITKRYPAGPCGAWQHSQDRGWS